MNRLDNPTTPICGYQIENRKMWKIAATVGVLLCALGIFGALGLAQHCGTLNCGEEFASLIGKIKLPSLGVMTGFGIIGFALATLGVYKTQASAKYAPLETQGDIIKPEAMQQETIEGSLNRRFLDISEMHHVIQTSRTNLLFPIVSQDRLINNQCVYLPTSDRSGIFLRKKDNRYSYLDARGGHATNAPSTIKQNLEGLGFTFPENDRHGVKFEDFSTPI